MPELNKQKIKEKLSWFEKWRKPDEMLEHSRQLMEHMASDTSDISTHLFNQPGVDFITEAYAAAQFAGIRDAESVRLAPEHRPDFQVRTTARDEEDWELTEADEISRKRGDEYRKENDALAATGKRDFKCDPVKNWQARSVQIPVVLKERSRMKAEKDYPSKTRLLIYLNIDDGYGTYQKVTEACMAEATAPAKNAFAEVWVLWKLKAYPLWDRGKPHRANPISASARWTDVLLS